MAQEHPTAAAMDSFIGCRLRSLKPSKPSNSSKSLPNSAGKRHPTAAAIASFIGVQGCHLPGLKGSKRSTPSTSPPSSAGKRYPNKPNTRHSRMQNAQLRRQASVIGVQGCHLPGLKGSKRSTPSTSPPSSAGKRYPNKATTRHSRMQNAQLRRQASVVRAFKPAVCQASNP